MKKIPSYVVRGACLLLVFCACCLAKAQQDLPQFSTEDDPVYYYVRFKRTDNFLKYMGSRDGSRKTRMAAIRSSAVGNIPAGYFLSGDGTIYSPVIGEYRPLVNQVDKDSCCWAFVDYDGETSSFLMKTKSFPLQTESAVAEYLSYSRNRFVTTVNKDEAVRMQFVETENNCLQLRRVGSNNCMNMVGGGPELGEWTANDVNNYFYLIPESDLALSLLMDITSMSVGVEHKDSYYFTRIDEENLEEEARSVGFLDEVHNPRRVTEHNYQNVNMREREIFVKRGESVNLLLPNYMSTYSTRSTSYQRWYDYDTDGPITEGGLNFDGAIRRVAVQKNGFVLGSGISGTSCSQKAVFCMPMDGKQEYSIACDMSKFSDYIKDTKGKGIKTEPTLDVRALYRIKDARIIADSLEKCQGDTWFEDEEIHFPTRVNCNLFGQTLSIRYDGRNYYVYNETGNDVVHVTPQVLIEDPHDLGITLREHTVRDDSHYLYWGYPTLSNNSVRAGIRNGTGTNEDYVVIKAVIRIGSKTYNIARYKVFFDEATEPRPINEVLGNRESLRSPEYMRLVAGEPLQSLTYDFTPVGYVAPGKSRTSQNTFAFPRPYSNVSYGYSSILGTNGINANNGDVSWGEYSIVHQIKLPVWGSNGHQTVFKDISTLYYNWYKEHGTEEEKAIYCKDDKESVPGYFAFMDASERPGQIAKIPMEKNLCGGSKIYVSAWIGSACVCYNGDVSQGRRGVDTDGAPASLSFDFIGVRGNEEVSIYTFCPGQISGFYIVDDNGSDKFVCPGNDEPGVWKHVAFSFVVDEVFERYELRLVNNCKHSNGGDILLDDVQIFVRSPEVEMEQIAPLCGNEVQHFKVSAEFGSILSAMGQDEVTSVESAGYKKFDCYYCFIDKNKFDKEFLNSDGSRPVYTQADQERYDAMFDKLVIGDVTEKPGSPKSAFHLFSMSNMYKDREEYSLEAALADNERACYWEDIIDEEGIVHQRNIVFTSRIVSDSLEAGKDYYVVFRVGASGQNEGENEDSESSIPIYVFFNLLSECVVTDTFNLRASSMTKIDGEIVPDGEIVYCAGTVPTIKVNMEGVGDAGVIERPDDRYDWYLGTMVEFNEKKVGDGPDAVSLPEALKNFRHHYPDYASAVDAEPKLSDPLFAFTEAMRDSLVKFSEPSEGEDVKLLLYRNNISYALGPEKGREYHIVVIPRDRSEMDLDSLTLFCYDPKEIVIKADSESPEGLTGLFSIHYPDGYGAAPLRISLSQINDIRSSANYTLTVPLRKLKTSSGKVYQFRKGDDANVYVVETDDPSFELYETDKETGEEYLNPVGMLLDMVAVVGPDDAGKDNHVVLRFDKSFVPKEGYTYTLRLSFRELSTDISQSSCGGHVLFPIKIVPDYQVWTGDAGNTDWNNDGNWRRADKAELLPAGDVYADYLPNDENYPAVDGGKRSVNCFAPIRTTSVIIPAGKEVYPVLTDRYSPGTDDDFDPDEIQPETETPGIRFDMVTDKLPTAVGSGGYAGISYYANACKEVNFQPASEMSHTERLEYDRAWVEYELDCDRWYTLGTPLQGMYSGEWYAPTEGARQLTPYFVPVSWDASLDDRFGPAVYQHGWDKAEANVYRMQGTEGDNPWNVAVMAEWSNVYNDVNVPYDLGGFSVKVVPMKATMSEEKKALFRMPKADESYTYYTYDNAGTEGDRLTSIVRPAQTHYRLYTDLLKGEESTYFGQSFKNASSENSYFLVGNPFVCGLDMDKFFEANSDLEKKYYVVTANTQAVYVKNPDNGYWVGNDGTLSPAVLAPLQGFFVRKSASAGSMNEQTVRFTANMQVSTSGRDVHLQSRPLRGRAVSAAASEGLTVTAVRGGESSRALLICSPGAADGYVPGEEAELLLDAHLFSGATNVPAVYTVADGYALSINRVRGIGRIPLGVAGRDRTDVTLRFDGVESVGSEVSLYDAEQDTSVPLRSGMEISVSGNTSGRYYLMGAPSSEGTAAAAAVSVGVSGNVVTVKAPSGDRLCRVRVIDASGRCVYVRSLDEDTHVFRLQKGVYVIEAATDRSAATVKALVG